MKGLINLTISALAVILGAYLIPGIHVDGFLTALITALVLALINIFVRPILVLLTIPVTLVTMGLFLLVINAAMIKLAGFLISGFDVEGFWAALFLSFVLSIVNWLFRKKD